MTHRKRLDLGPLTAAGAALGKSLADLGPSAVQLGASLRGLMRRATAGADSASFRALREDRLPDLARDDSSLLPRDEDPCSPKS